MESFFVCPICGNSDPVSIGYRNGKPYCRKCIAFSGEKAPNYRLEPLNITKQLNYELTKEQAEIASKVKENFINHKNTLIYAVTGAGKTELVYDVIEYCLRQGLQVGFTVPRKEVVIELGSRIKNAFPSSRVITVFGDHHKVLTGNIIVLTTHQLFRYEKYFDLLIFDEVDAFPYKGNVVLENFFHKSVRGNYVIMSATPSDTMMESFKKDGEILTLFTRFHGHEIPVPKIKYGFYLLNIVLVIRETKKLIAKGKVVFIFCPTIKEAELLYKITKVFIKEGGLIHSKVPNNSKIIEEFKKGKRKYLVTTSVLERGITIKGLQVLIFHADHKLYTKEALVQISGRVGRKKDEPSGEVIYYISQINSAISTSIEDIKNKNVALQNLLQQN